MHEEQESKPLVWLGCNIKTPPLSHSARVEAGWLLRRLQQGESLGIPYSRPMPGIGPGCHELRVTDENRTWRVVYRLSDDAIFVVAVFPKTTRSTSGHDIEICKERLKVYDTAVKKRNKGARP